jgi:transmembrane protein EpsG
MNASFLIMLFGSFCVILTALAYKNSYVNSKMALKIVFIIIFLFLGLRYQFGNDYRGYITLFNEANSYDSFHVALLNAKRREIGWFLLNYIFGFFGTYGFQIQVFVLSIFNSVVYYKFIVRYCPPAYYWFAVFIYIFNPANMLIQSSAMRQSLSICIFLLAIDFLIRKKLFAYIIAILFASLFHISALVLLPLYLLNKVNFTLGRKIPVFFLLFFVFIWLSGDIVFFPIRWILNKFFADIYLFYVGGRELDTGLGVLFQFSYMLAFLYFYKFNRVLTSDATDSRPKDLRIQKMTDNIIIMLSLIYYMFIPLGLYLGMISRVSMYFSPILIVGYPVMLSKIKSESIRVILIVLLIFFTLYTYFLFFLPDSGWITHFGIYKTIFNM